MYIYQKCAPKTPFFLLPAKFICLSPTSQKACDIGKQSKETTPAGGIRGSEFQLA